LNLHTHTNYCDGKSTVQELHSASKQLNWKYLGISSHAPLPFSCEWAIDKKNIQHYLHEINTFRDIQPNITLFQGWEIDYLRGTGYPALELDSIRESDYFICSLHFLRSPLKNQEYIEIDGTLVDFIRCLSQHENSFPALIEAYFLDLHAMLKEYVPSTKVIGHIDKFLLNAEKLPSFYKYKNLFTVKLLEWLEESIDTNTIIEINTRSIYKYNWTMPYPGIDALKYISEKKIPCIISSDAHRSTELNLGFDIVHSLCACHSLNLNILNEKVPEIIRQNKNA
jgi:histidinol-phosphatase (PHP family)